MLEFVTRPQASSTMRFASPLLAAALTVVGGFIVFWLLGRDPWTGLQVFFIKPLTTWYGVTEWLLKATPLALIALGLAVGFRANIWNIGAEGQFVLGAIGATGVALYLPASSHWIMLPAMVAAGAVFGMLWAAIPAWLKTRFNANEILVSLMLVYVAKLLVTWFVFGPWKDPDGFNFPQTKMFADAALLPVLADGMRLNLAFVFVLFLLVIGHIFMTRSRLGFQMRVAGEAPAAARYAGYSAARMIWMGLLSGGAAAGIAGMAEVAGPMGQLTPAVSANYGFAAIIVAFVGRLNAIGIALASLLMSLLYLGGEQAQQYLGLPASIANVFQGMLLFSLLGADVFIEYRLQRMVRA
jgi:simple sugar transport system permease protein